MSDRAASDRTASDRTMSDRTASTLVGLRAPIRHRLRRAADRAVVPLALWCLSRLVVVTIGVVANALQPGAARVFADPSWPVALFDRWDANYYLGIASVGYSGPGSDPTWAAFFPGYPTLVRLVATAIDGGHPPLATVQAAGMLVVTLASAVAAVLLWETTRVRFGRRPALVATGLLLFSPYAMVLVAPYSESLYLAFAVAAWLLALRRHWVWAGVLTAAASATRVNGVFLAIAIGVQVVVSLRDPLRDRLARGVGAAGIGLAGIGAYFLYLWHTTGNPSAWQAAEHAGWHRSTHWPWVTFLNTMGRVLRPAISEPHRLQSTLDLVAAVLTVAGTVWLVRRRAWAGATLVGLTAASMLTSTNYMSMARGTILLFPLMIELAPALVRGRHSVVVLAAVVSAALLAVDAWSFAIGLWAD